MENPTPFIRAEHAQWQILSDGSMFLPARVYLNGRAPEIVVKRGYRRGRIIIGEHPQSGFGGIMLDRQLRYAGSIRRRIEKKK